MVQIEYNAVLLKILTFYNLTFVTGIRMKRETKQSYSGKGNTLKNLNYLLKISLRGGGPGGSCRNFLGSTRWILEMVMMRMMMVLMTMIMLLMMLMMMMMMMISREKERGDGYEDGNGDDDH